MDIMKKRDAGIIRIVNHSLEHEDDVLTVTFLEGDSYLCYFENGEWEDNGEWNPGEDTRNLPGYEEWYEVALRVKAIVTPGPNKDPRFEYIVISRKHMPVRVTAGDTVLYEE